MQSKLFGIYSVPEKKRNSLIVLQNTHPNESESFQDQENFGKTLLGMEQTTYSFTEGRIRQIIRKM
jgi:hypothetical protein